MDEYLTNLYRTRNQLVTAGQQLTKAYRHGDAAQKAEVNMLLLSINAVIKSLSALIPMDFKPVGDGQ